MNKIFALIFIIIFMYSCNTENAETVEFLEQKIMQLERQIDRLKETIDGLESNIQDFEEKLDDLTNIIGNLERHSHYHY